MSLAWHGEQRLVELKAAAAEGLLRAAVYFRTQHQQRLSVPSPHHAVRRKRTVVRGGATFKRGTQYQLYDAPSKEGEYLKLRTGHGRGSVTVEPATAAGIAAAGLVVRIGYRLPPGKYMLRWEAEGRRKGLADTLADTREQLAALARIGR